jgi:hypothetical protein
MKDTDITAIIAAILYADPENHDSPRDCVKLARTFQRECVKQHLESLPEDSRPAPAGGIVEKLKGDAPDVPTS